MSKGINEMKEWEEEIGKFVKINRVWMIYVEFSKPIRKGELLIVYMWLLYYKFEIINIFNMYKTDYYRRLVK